MLCPEHLPFGEHHEGVQKRARMAVGRDASLSSDESDDDLGLSGNVTRSAKSVRVRHGSGQFSTQAELFEAWRKDGLVIRHVLGASRP